MGAPTNAANVKKVLANSEPSTQGGKATVAECAPDVQDDYVLARLARDFRGGRTIPGIKR